MFPNYKMKLTRPFNPTLAPLYRGTSVKAKRGIVLRKSNTENEEEILINPKQFEPAEYDTYLIDGLNNDLFKAYHMEKTFYSTQLREEIKRKMCENEFKQYHEIFKCTVLVELIYCF